MTPRVARPFGRRGVRAVTLPLTHFRRLDGARRAALAGAIAIAAGALSGIPDFGWIEGAQLLMAVCILRLLARPLEKSTFPLPFHDHTLLVVSGVWTAIVTLANAFDGADTGTGLIVFGGCVLVSFAGLRVRTYGEHYWFE